MTLVQVSIEDFDPARTNFDNIVGVMSKYFLLVDEWDDYAPVSKWDSRDHLTQLIDGFKVEQRYYVDDKEFDNLKSYLHARGVLIERAKKSIGVKGNQQSDAHGKMTALVDAMENCIHALRDEARDEEADVLSLQRQIVVDMIYSATKQ